MMNDGDMRAKTALELLRQEIRFDINELHTTGRMSRARDLSDITHVHFNHNKYPMYFTGDPGARFVLVHLNPKQKNGGAGEFEGDFYYPDVDHDVDEYIERHRRYGYYHWRLDPTYRSRFDHKQVRFLRPFDRIDFLPGNTDCEKRANCERAIDQKLQLELIPYGSPNFQTHELAKHVEVLAPHYKRLMAVVTACARDYVIFCGTIFETLLGTHIIEREDCGFRLPTSTGEGTRRYHFSNLVLRYDGHDIRVGLAPSFPIPGIPMDAYGAKCHELYPSLIPG